MSDKEFNRKMLMQIIENNQDSSAQDIAQIIKEQVLLFKENTSMSGDITLIALKDKGARQFSLDAKEVRDYVALLNRHSKNIS